MKEITLDEAYQRATPRPLARNIPPITKYPTLYGGDAPNHEHVAHVLFGRGMPDERAETNAALLCHAFNVLPEVVEALADLEYRVSCALGVTTKLPQNPLGEAMNKARSALAKAQTVKVPLR